jgi:hypothetical protein
MSAVADRPGLTTRPTRRGHGDTGSSREKASARAHLLQDSRIHVTQSWRL